MSVPAVRRSVQDEYRRLAPHYDERWAGYVERTTQRTLEFLQARPRESILDVGCGTGAVMRAVLAAVPEARVTGIDISTSMLALARERLVAAGAAKAALAAADAAAIPAAIASFDAVVSVSSFHYWSDPDDALHEIMRVLRPGGRLVLTDWCDDFLACQVCDRWLRLTRSSYQRIYGSTACRALVEGAGFAVETLARYKVSWLWGMMTVVARKG